MLDRSHIGRDNGERFVDVEASQVRLFCQAIGETDPVFLDADAARAAGHPAIPVPATFASALDYLAPQEEELVLDVLAGRPRALAPRRAEVRISSPDLRRRPGAAEEADRRHLRQEGRRAGVHRAGDRAAQPDRRALRHHAQRRRVEELSRCRPQHVWKSPPATPCRNFTTAPITPLTLALFAGGSGDHNPIHLDPEFARASGFDEVFAHGMLSMAYLGRLLTRWAPVGALREFGVRFVSITPLRAEVTCRGRVAEVIERDGERLARLEVSTVLPDGTVTLQGDALVAIG